MKFLYKYPQRAYPYALLIEENRRRGRQAPEYELLDTGVFDEDRYFDVFVEYAKGSPEDILIRIQVVNRGPETAGLDLLPTIWFHNTWSWGYDVRHYLATAPSLFAGVINQLGLAGLTHEANGRWRRVIIEKPFGHDYASARTLNHDIRQVLEEKQIYRIDHYLGKETVRNILVFRFANGIFEPIWNRRYIDHVQLTVAETVGVEERGPYYDETGALRDMVPNHIFQLITLMAMEPPISFEADAVRDEQTKILRAVERLTPNLLVLHVQPDEGISLRFGAKIPGPLVRLGAVNMDFRYADYFGSTPSTGYERLLYDCMTGDATLFQRADMVEASWSVVAPIQDVWKALPPRNFPNYAAGTWGPKEADELLGRDGRQWRRINE